MSEIVGNLGRSGLPPERGFSGTRSRLLGATVSRDDMGASENVFQIAEIGLESAGPLMGGTVV